MAQRASSGADRDQSPRPRLAETVAEQRRQAVADAIETAAMQLFAARPMTEVTTEEIAERAGIAARTLYRYFPTKEHIFTALPRRGAERLTAAILARPAGEPPFLAMREALSEVAGDTEIAELQQWLQAIVASGATDRIGRMAVVVSTEELTRALAERAGLPVDHLWPQMAASMAAAALTVGTRQWAVLGGDMVEHQLAALDIAGDGIARAPKPPSTSRRR